MTKVFTTPDKPRLFFRQIMREMFKLGFTSIPIVAIISMFIGAVIALQMALNFVSPLLPKEYIGMATRETLLLEFSSTVIALILAGKVGSNIASEIGSMRITEQIDAMEIMGLNSANYLILPKVIALVIFNPFLAAMSNVLGILGGAILVTITQVISLADYVNGIQFYFNGYYVFYGLIKMAVFSILITTIPAYYGYYANGGSLGVGQASTRSIVATSIFILIFDLMLTQILLQ